MSLFGDIAGFVGAEKAEDKQYAASQAALAEQRRAYEDAKSGLSPYTQMGTDSTALISRLFGLNGQPADMSAFTASPGYQFRLQQGQDAIGRSAAAQGGLFSGAAGKALNDYAQNTASQEFDNYLNRLFGMSGSGQQAATNLGGWRMGNGNNMANIQTQIGDNQSKRIMSQYNALGSMGDDLVGAATAAFGGGMPGAAAGAGGAGGFDLMKFLPALFGA